MTTLAILHHREPGRWSALLPAVLLMSVSLSLVACGDRNAAPTTGPADPYTATATESGPITSLGMLTSPADPAGLEGREVQLMDVHVADIIDDNTFYITQSRAAGAGAAGIGVGTTGTAATGAPAGAGTADAGAAAGTPPGMAGTADRIRVSHQLGLLGGATGQEALRIGQTVDVYGEVRAGGMGAPRTGAGTTGGTGTAGTPSGIYIQARRVESRDPAEMGVGPGAPGVGTGPQGY